MFKSKRAQAAMEFLMTYGWALLVVLIAIAALAFFGLLNPSRFLPEKCTVPPGFGCGGYAASGGAPLTATALSNENLTFYLTNGLGESIYNVNISIPECKTGTGIASMFNASVEQRTYVNGTLNNPLTVINMNEGETAQFGSICNVTHSLVSGDRFRGTMVINYQTRFENTLQTHTKTGDLIVAIQ